MSNIVYILGAGFSQPLGLPVMKHFIRKSREIAKKADQFKYIDELLESLWQTKLITGVFEYDHFNIEDALSMLEVSEYFGDRSRLQLFKRYINDVIQESMPQFPGVPGLKGTWKDLVFGENEKDDRFQCYGHFVASIHGWKVIREPYDDPFGKSKHAVKFIKEGGPYPNYSIITLNYDRVLETYCEYIERHSINRNMRATFLREKLKSGVDVKLPYLAKLHGSIGNDDIIPPTYLKGIYQKDLPQSWSLAYELLMEANQIRIIGYSLPQSDSYIKYILKSALSRGSGLDQLDVICLDSDNSVKQRYDEFITFEPYKFLNKSVGDYLGKVYSLRTTERDQDVMNFDKLEIAHEEFMKERIGAHINS